jgi:hypothetical protein
VVYLFAGDNAALLPVASLGIWLYFWGCPWKAAAGGGHLFPGHQPGRIASLLTGGKLVLIGGFLWGFSSCGEWPVSGWRCLLAALCWSW